MKVELSIEDVIKIFENEETNWEGDNAMQGLEILKKYSGGGTVIEGAGHDEIWSIDVEKACENGLTRQDAEKLRELNWMLNDETYFACFV